MRRACCGQIRPAPPFSTRRRRPRLPATAIDPKSSAALQIARIAGTLAHGAAPRLERLRGFGGRFGGALLCSCSRVMLADRAPAILVVATEPAGPRLALDEQARRLLAGVDDPVALFAADGALLHATPLRPGAAQRRRHARRARRACARRRCARRRTRRRRQRGRRHLPGAARRRRDDHAAGKLCAASCRGNARRGGEAGCHANNARSGRAAASTIIAGIGRGRTPSAAALRLADGCRRPLRARLRGIPRR